MNLSDLREALSPLAKFGQEEHSFDIPQENGSPLTVTLRPLLPHEETACQSRAVQILKQAEDEELGEDTRIDRALANSYFDMFRAEVVSYAIVQVGRNDFRGFKTIQTGKTLPNWVPEQVPLNQALRDLILESWSRAMLTICFSKYGDLVSKIAKKADLVVASSLNEIEAEIERTKKRLETLLEEREKRGKGDPSTTLDHVKTLVEFGDQMERRLKGAVEEAEEEARFRKEMEELDQQEQQEQEERGREQREGQGLQVPQEREQVQEAPVAASPPPRKSLVPDEAPPPTSVPNMSQESRIRAAQQALEEFGGVDVANAVPAGELTTPEGKPVQAYRLPSETITQRGRPSPHTAPTKVAETGADPRRGTENPNFRPPKR